MPADNEIDTSVGGGQVLIYTDGSSQLQVRLEGETV